MRQLLEQNSWLQADAEGIVRVPALVKGRVLGPPALTLGEIERAFATVDAERHRPATTATVGDALVLRERRIDPATRRPSDAWAYQVVPTVAPADLIEADPDRLVAELYNRPLREILDVLERVGEFLADHDDVTATVRELAKVTSEHPAAYVDLDFDALPILLDGQAAASMVDAELGAFGVAGSRFLDGWVDIEAEPLPGPAHLIAAERRPIPTLGAPRLRAMPTRQLHITAGNAPLIPLVSCLRALWTKSAAVVKLPFGATVLGSLFGVALAQVAPEHPLTRSLSLLYWRGGDEAFESRLFAPGAFDRIVVWGAPEAVTSVRRRVAFTKTLCFNPRYAVSFIGAAALGDVEATAEAAVADTLIQNQKACIASQIHYVEGDRDQAQRYAAAVARELARWDEWSPQGLSDWHRGQIKRLRRGSLLDADWHLNQGSEGSGGSGGSGSFNSAAVVVEDGFDVRDHPMCRLVVVRPVARLEDALGDLSPFVATVGIAPETRREQLQDRIAARGVSNVVRLGEAGRTFAGMSHDGMLVLSELVDWKNG